MVSLFVVTRCLYCPATSTRGESHLGLGLQRVFNSGITLDQRSGWSITLNKDENGYVAVCPKCQIEQPNQGFFCNIYTEMWLADWTDTSNAYSHHLASSSSARDGVNQLELLIDLTGLTVDQVDEFAYWLWENGHFVVRESAGKKIISFLATEELLAAYKNSLALGAFKRKLLQGENNNENHDPNPHDEFLKFINAALVIVGIALDPDRKEENEQQEDEKWERCILECMGIIRQFPEDKSLQGKIMWGIYTAIDSDRYDHANGMLTIASNVHDFLVMREA